MTSVLIVDDEPAVRDIMARWAASLGLQARTAASADEALDTLRREHCDLAVIDIMMPGRDGLWLAGELQRDHPHTAVVLATGYTALLDAAGDQPPPIADLLIKPFARDRFVLAVDRGRQWRKAALDDVRWHAELAAELAERTTGVCTEVERLAASGFDEATALASIEGSRIPHVAAHGERVARYALSVARELGLGALAVLDAAARFHDVGKVAIPDSLLTKPSPFTPGEHAIMKQHVDAGAAILQSTQTLAAAAPIVVTTHEWFGGGGYPRQLAGEAIPLASRIIAVVDAYDAMTQDRVYRTRLDAADAVAELIRCALTQFDPDIIDVFLRVLARQ